MLADMLAVFMLLLSATAIYILVRNSWVYKLRMKMLDMAHDEAMKAIHKHDSSYRRFIKWLEEPCRT